MSDPERHANEATPRFAEVRSLFVELAELDSGERARRLDALAANDPELAREVTSLFASERAAGDFLAAPAGQMAPELMADVLHAADSATAVGRVIGAWRLVAPLGRGGMGEVYAAERVDGQYEQRAALKLVKRGMDSTEIVRRFLLERQILARLTHPGIARLLDGGRAEDGRPFLVLELVQGKTITEHCSETAASVGQRLRLVLEACDAVDSAHRQLVVHRDLKPSNVLVESGSGRVKLLDFGIAKLLHGGDEGDEEADATQARLTRTGFSVMTPAYAAPEQILGEPATTATDVYSLGVLLYELLTGRLPHERGSASAAGLADAVSRESVARPSRVAAEGGDRKLERALAGDLDTILLKSLAREPERRYASVAAFAEDLRRHLEGRPVLARPDSTGYRVRKFVGRNRVAVAAALAAVVALAVGLAVALAQARRADREATTARREAARAERVRQVLTSIFEVSDPVRARGETVTAKNLLDEGARRVDAELAGDPDLRAEMENVLAGLYRKLGESTTARDLAQKAWEERKRIDGPESAAAAKAEWTLGWTLSDQSEFALARRHLEHAIAVLDAVEGAASLAAADAREPLMELVFSADGPEAARPVVERRLATYRAVLGENDVRTALSMSDLGVILTETDQLDEAERQLRRSIAILDAVLPPGDPRTAFPHGNLANTLMSADRAAEAEAEALRAIEIRTKALGPSHRDTLNSRGQLLQIYMKLDRLADAERIARENLAAVDPKDLFSLTQARSSLGQVLLRQERYEEAVATFEEAIEERRQILAPDHILNFVSRINWIRALAGAGRTEQARREVARIIPELEKKGTEGAQYLKRAKELEAKLAGG